MSITYFDISSFPVLLIYEIGDIFASAIALGATAYAVSAIYFGDGTRIGDVLRKVSPKIGRMVTIRFAVRFLTIIGTILLVYPGLFWLASYSLAIPAAVLEDLPVKSALTRSNKLSDGGRRRILDVYVMFFILRLVLVGTLGWIERLIFNTGHAANRDAFDLLQPLLDFGINTLAFPLLSISLVLVYYDQRVRKEAFDLQLLMTALGESPTPTTVGASSAIG